MPKALSLELPARGRPGTRYDRAGSFNARNTPPMPDCSRQFRDDQLAPAPKLVDAVWKKLADPREFLCGDCFFKRAIARCIPVTLSDLQRDWFNLVHEPDSWFNLFTNGEASAAVAAWRGEATFSLWQEIPKGTYGKPALDAAAHPSPTMLIADIEPNLRPRLRCRPPRNGGCL
jgi:hypothetical protein